MMDHPLVNLCAPRGKKKESPCMLNLIYFIATMMTALFIASMSTSQKAEDKVWCACIQGLDVPTEPRPFCTSDNGADIWTCPAECKFPVRKPPRIHGIWS